MCWGREGNGGEERGREGEGGGEGEEVLEIEAK